MLLFLDQVQRQSCEQGLTRNHEVVAFSHAVDKEENKIKVGTKAVLPLGLPDRDIRVDKILMGLSSRF